ncbi:hypothetical protein NDU88_002871 [Pleurodeles waltl]|uniref:Uncharacterized protein n=1 Tax=Pleurodeles waltl TaxID=8319 RepID=A0AAV7UZS3_PLEWA|nr:hypothetical protein NDU88_002871 [Pleurodeles waltl]
MWVIIAVAEIRGRGDVLAVFCTASAKYTPLILALLLIVAQRAPLIIFFSFVERERECRLVRLIGLRTMVTVFPKLKKLSVRIRTSHPPNPCQNQILRRILGPGQARVWIRVEIIHSKDVQIRMVAFVSVPGILCLDVGSCFVRLDDVAIIDFY